MKDTIKLYILVESEKNLWAVFETNPKNLIIDHSFPILKKLNFSGKFYLSHFFSHIIP